MIGPPGCGKTTYVKRQVENAAHKLGASEVMVCSLTRAAAAEIKGRELPIPDERVGTLHSFAYRAIGCPKIAEAKVKEWNAAHPRWALSLGKVVTSPEDDQPDDRGGDGGPGDEPYEAMQLLRHAMRPRHLWPSGVQAFASAWDGWRQDEGFTDFTGMIEDALSQADVAPGRPLAMFVDEAQDMSALEVALVRKWGDSCSTVVAVGDPAQSLYEWRGAGAESFLDVSEAGNRHVLAQSWRVPRAAHRLATRWAGRLLDGIAYMPTDANGSVETSEASLRWGDSIADIAEAHIRQSESGSLMIQGLCSYMLSPALAALRERGIPFHNPRRVARGDWNPLAERKGTSTVTRLRAFLTEDQTVDTVKAWLPMLRSEGVLARGAKERIKDDEPLVDVQEVIALFASRDVAERAFSGDAAWLAAHVSADYAKRLTYPLNVVKRWGISLLDEEPRVLIGTIHSFKGSEADHVLVSPDLSPAAFEEHVIDRPSVRRAFYVALTRTRDRLTLLAPSSRRSVWLQ